MANAGYSSPVYGPPAPRQLQSIPGQYNQISGGYNRPSGSVLGATTFSGSGTGHTNVSSGGGSAPTDNGGGQPSDPYASLRSDIGSAWDSYLNSLGGVSGYLNDQQTAQQGIANSQLSQGQGVVNTQKASSLRDIANTTRSAFQAGNNYLGSLGAGDSSAANQYSFAINQQAGKQTGQLNEFVNGQLNQLQSAHDQQVNQIAQWFAQQQEALKQQIAQGGLSKSQDLNNLSKGILDQATQATNQIKANTQNGYNALLGWAAQNSQGFGQLQGNVANINSMYRPGQLQGISTIGGQSPSYGGAAQNNGGTDIWGNRIQQ